jgi:Mannosyltransferase (PIG-V)
MEALSETAQPQASASHHSNLKSRFNLIGEPLGVYSRLDRVFRRTSSVKSLLIGVAGMWLVTRVGYVVLTFFLNTLEPPAVTHWSDLVLSWDQWDTGHYMHISLLGYTQPERTAFFPLFPGLISGITNLIEHWHLPASPANRDLIRFAVGLAVANAASLVVFTAMALFAFQDAEETGRKDAAWRAVRMLAAYPFAFYLAAAYSESLALALAILTFWLARRRHWWWAAIAGVLAGLARPTSVALVVPLVWEFGHQQGWWQAIRCRRWPARPSWAAMASGIAGVASVPAAMSAYAVYVWSRFGDPFVFLKAEHDTWGRDMTAPWTTAHMVLERFTARPLLDHRHALLMLAVTPVVGLVVIIVIGYRQLPFGAILYLLGLIGITVASPAPASDEILVSAGRYLLLAFPIFPLLARWTSRRPNLEFGLLFIGIFLQGAFVYTFIHGGWVA